MTFVKTIPRILQTACSVKVEAESASIFNFRQDRRERLRLRLVFSTE